MADRRSFIKQIGWGTAGVGLLSVFPGTIFPSTAFHDLVTATSGKGLIFPRSSPEEQGVNELAALSHPPPQFNGLPPGDAAPAIAAALSGKKFILDENPFYTKAVSFAQAGDRVVFTLMEEGKPDIVINCGMNRWILDGNRKPEAHSLFSLRRIDFDSQVAASAGWSAADTLVLTFRYIETCHGDSLTCIFDKDSLRIKFLFSATRLENKPDERADITGKAII